MGQNVRAPIDEGSILIQPLSLGVFGFGGFNVHTASFSGFRGTPSCCPEYTHATLLGGSFGILGQYAIDSQFGVGMRMGFNGLGGDFSSEEIQYVMSQTGFATITHSMETSLGILSLEPQGIYKIEKANIFGGLWLGFPLAMQFSQRESIFPGTFDGLNRIRNEISGDIPGTPSILFGISGGVSYELPMNVAGNIRLAPEVRGFANFNEFSESTHWKAFGIRVGASLLWSPIVNIPPPPPPPPIIIKPLPELLTNIFVSTEGKDPKTAIDSFVLTERVDRVVQPILPFVFFEEGSSEIPQRYRMLNQSEISSFNEQSMMSLDALGRYHHVLNLAALRLRNDPSLTLTVIGASSGGGQEKRNLVLAKKRAETVAGYFRDIWNIDQNRIIIKAKGIPDNPSNISYSEGLAENRRVELQFSDPSMFEVLSIMDSVLSVQPEQVLIRGSMISGTMIDSWRLTIMTDTNFLQEKLGMHDTFVISSLRINPNVLGKNKDSLRFRYNVVDTAGRSHTSTVIIPISYLRQLNDRTIDNAGNDKIKRYSLILFDFDAATMNDRNMRVINEINSTKGIKVTSIIGATDKSGDQKRNTELAMERAKAVGVLLNVDPSLIKGNSAYEGTNNALPEGRFYNRTVIIEAKEE